MGKPTITIKTDEVEISDGYHTFTELYEHRIVLFIQLCKWLTAYTGATHKGEADLLPMVWRSKRHSDGSEWDGWFIMGIGQEKGKQISYHLPMNKWKDTDWVNTLDKAPEWDGHTPNDVLERLSKLF